MEKYQRKATNLDRIESYKRTIAGVRVTRYDLYINAVYRKTGSARKELKEYAKEHFSVIIS